MKRVDKNKVYKFLGQATVYATIYIGAVAMAIYGFLQNTIY